MADVIRFPLVVVEGLDVSLFPSIQEAEEYLDGAGAAGKACAAFDAEGRALRIDAAAGQKVRVELAETRPGHSDDLRRHLHDYLQACGQPLGPEATLRDLILRCRSMHLYRE